MIDNKIAQKILQKHDLGELRSLKKHETGVTGSVFEINSRFILKSEMDKTDSLKIERNAFTCRLLEKHGIKAPQLIALDVAEKIIPQKYLIMSKLEGQNLRDVWKTLPEDEQKRLFFEYGKLMAQFHKIPMQKFGDPVNPDHLFDSWHDCLIARYRANRDYAEQNKIVPSEMVKSVDNFFRENDELLHVKAKPVFIHNDFQAKNIKYLDGNLNGIFDFDECLAAHNEFDFIKTYLPFKREKVWLKEILKGYKTMGALSKDFEARIRLYELNFAFKVLAFLHANNILTDEYRKKFLWAIDAVMKEDARFFSPLHE